MNTQLGRKVEGFPWIALGTAISVLSWQSQLGSLREPGPGFIGFIAGLFVAVIGLIMVLTVFTSRGSLRGGAGTDITFPIAARPRLLYTVVLLIGYGLLLNTLGYIVTTFLVMWGLFYERGKGRLISSCFASVVTAVITYLVFDVWLRCQFPRGIFPWR